MGEADIWWSDGRTTPGPDGASLRETHFFLFW